MALQDQPLHLLLVLLERPGEIVTRDDLRQRLWGADRFLDHDAALNTAVRKLRDALHDSPADPRYVETVARHGYRFIADVARDGPAAPAAPAAPPPGLAPVASAITPPPVATTASRRGGRRILWALAAGALVLIALAATWLAVRERRQPIRSLAVLPLEDLSEEPRSEIFADGLTDELTTAIAKRRVVRVTSRTSAERFRSPGRSVPEIGRLLGVDGVIEGSVRKARDRVRVTVQLVDARSDDHVWADSFDGDARDLLGLQQTIAEAVAHRVGERLAPGAPRGLAPRLDARAHEAYLRGRALFSHRTPESLRQAAASFAEAVRIEPRYAAAHAELANTWLVLTEYTDLSEAEALARAEPEARLALRLDPAAAEAHVALALAASLRLQLRESVREFERATALNPSLALAHQWNGETLILLGRFDAGLRELATARALDPFSPAVRWTQGWALTAAGRPAEAVAELERTVRDFPDVTGRPYHLLGVALQQLGRREQARAAYATALQRLERRRERQEVRSHLFVLADDLPGWRAQVAARDRLAPDDQLSPTLVAATFAGLSDRGAAFSWLRRALDEQDSDLVLLRACPDFATLQHDPSFVAIVERVGLDPARSR